MTIIFGIQDGIRASKLEDLVSTVLSLSCSHTLEFCALGNRLTWYRGQQLREKLKRRFQRCASSIQSRQ